MFADPMAWTIEHGYPVLFGMLLFSGLGVPIPEDVPLIAAGVLASQGGMGVIQASIVCSFFVLCRDLAVFTLGYRFGDVLLDGRWGRRIVRPADLQRAEARLRERGTAVVFIGRFLPGLRAAVFFAAGKARIPPLKFLAVDALAALVSIPAFVLAGYLCAANIDVLVQVLREFRILLIIGALIGLLVVLIRLRRRSHDAPPQA